MMDRNSRERGFREKVITMSYLSIGYDIKESSSLMDTAHTMVDVLEILFLIEVFMTDNVYHVL